MIQNADFIMLKLSRSADNGTSDPVLESEHKMDESVPLEEITAPAETAAEGSASTAVMKSREVS